MASFTGILGRAGAYAGLDQEMDAHNHAFGV